MLAELKSAEEAWTSANGSTLRFDEFCGVKKMLLRLQTRFIDSL